MTMPPISRCPDVPLAYEFLPGRGPVVVFCPGYASDMTGTKALALEVACRARGQAMLRFDYAGHGQSGGDFLDGTIGDWTADAAFIIDTIVPAQPVILVGSSMGGWIALLLARDLGTRVAGLILIAPAADLTERLLRPSLSPAQMAELTEKGVLYQPSEYGAPLPWTLKFLEEGARHLLLDGKIPITCPVHILHGMRDDAVPWRLSLQIADALESEAVRVIFLKDGDHRLSRPEDLALLVSSLAVMLAPAKTAL
jgi:pimeloyl-ACP methyl ester carboxylesterase